MMNISKIISLILLLMMGYLINTVHAESESVESNETQSWWEKRHKRTDIYFPHNIHHDVMGERGDVCMACHPFSGTPKTTIQQLEILTALSNEPLEAICHECHVVERSAPLDCKVCHTDINAVRPDDHGINYDNHHGSSATLDEGECRTCHIESQFCTDCHFSRHNTPSIGHTLGYRDRHGLDARLGVGRCASCHLAQYCQDCHRGKAL